MYLPERFAIKDLEKTLRIIREYPFATLVSIEAGEPFVSHIPLIAEVDSQDQVTLIGHLARANPHSRLLSDRPVYAIFHGPNSYITPRWYKQYDVPTWNYAVVHVRGHVKLIEDEDGIHECLRKLSDQVEGDAPDRWEFGITEDLAKPGVLAKAIVGFQIKVDAVQSKFKLGQNRSAADRQGVEQGLAERGDSMAHAMIALMREG